MPRSYYLSISDDDLCSDCAHCNYNPGEASTCELHWPATHISRDGYILGCDSFERCEPGVNQLPLTEI